jgi:hypothetical protein
MPDLNGFDDEPYLSLKMVSSLVINRPREDATTMEMIISIGYPISSGTFSTRSNNQY